MDKQQVVYEKITECMRTIFAFCISKTSNREDAEDLSQLISEGYIINNNGIYNANFPVFTEKQFDDFDDLLIPAIKLMKENIKLVISESAKVLENHAPSQLLDICPEISLIKCRNNAVGYIVEQMCTKGYLIVPNSLEKLGMCAVLK
jgi:hypothetical protein